MQERFNLGIYSSATVKTVAAARELLEEAAGPGPPLFPEAAIILHRVHTISATVDQKLNSGKDWDTMKPLQRYFSRMHQTLLVDDDAFKVRKPFHHEQISTSLSEQRKFLRHVKGWGCRLALRC